MTARKAAAKPPEPVMDTPPVSVTPEPVSITSEPVYVAARKMQRNGEVIKIGDVLPDAATWPRLESWIRAGYVKEAS